MRREIERFGGTVEKFIGDAVMAVYGAPVAHEDDAQRAVFSALRIPPAIEELNETNRDLPLAVRIGVETGVAVVSVGSKRSDQGIAIGDVVNTASRLQGVAPIGGILVGEGTHRLTKNVFDYEPLDPVQVKGKAERSASGSLRPPEAGSEPSSTGFRPRSWAGATSSSSSSTRSRARDENHPCSSSRCSGSRAGKSRIIRELFSYLDDQPELVAVWRHGRCLPYGEGVTFWALGEIVKAQAGILESDDARTARTKLGVPAALVEEPGEAEWIGSQLSPLVGLADTKNDGVEQMESFSAWRLFLEAIASQRPLVIAIEDLHWAQAAMIDFIRHVLEWSTGYPMLILCSARPELLQLDPQWGGGMRNSVIVSLPPLTDGETRTLLESILPNDTASDVYDLIAERAGGNPLFAEEFVRMLQDRSGGAAVGSDVAVLSDSSPESLDALIAARLDTLDIEEKSLLQDASVIGRVFWATAVAAVSGSDLQSVQSGLRDLAQRELVRPSRISSVQGDAEYAFAHALIRDVAYGQIPRLERVDKHVVAAGWIERLAVERVADHAELLAHHYGRPSTSAGPPGARPRRAGGGDPARADARRQALDSPGRGPSHEVLRPRPRAPARGSSGPSVSAVLESDRGPGRRPVRGGRGALPALHRGLPRGWRPDRRGQEPEQAVERAVGPGRVRREHRPPGAIRGDPRRGAPGSRAGRATRPPRRLGSWWVRSTRRSS